jgi:fibronectin type 3 domain-containing protein
MINLKRGGRKMKKSTFKLQSISIFTLFILLLTIMMPTKTTLATTSGEYKYMLSSSNATITPPTSVKAVSASYNSIKTTWGTVTGATAYRIYRATSSTGVYSYVTTRTSTSFTDTGVITGKAYYYKVRAYKTVGTTGVLSNYSSMAFAKPIPATPTSVKAVSASYNSIKTTWGTVTGATSYRVYRSTSSTGIYSYVPTATSTSFTDTGLIAGTTYYYKVRAYSTVGTVKVFSNYSPVVFAKPIPATPTLVKAVSISDSSIKTAWGGVKGANAYRVYSATSSTGIYSYVGTATSTSFTNTNLLAGKTYYYKVRAYSTVGTTKVFSNYSAVVSSTTFNKKGYVYNTDLENLLKVRSAPSLSGSIIGYLYNYEKIEILGTATDASNIVWDKIIYNGSVAYVSNSYIQLYTSPPDSVVNIAKNITKQFEVGISDQIAGDFDGQGLSLGYFQWCIGQGTLQPLLYRMDKQYNSEMKSIFGTNYDTMHRMLLDTPANQLKWAQSINNSTDTIIAPWYSQLNSLRKNENFIKIEQDAEVYSVKQAMIICDKYKLKTVRGFALALDIVVQNGSISSDATKIIDIALGQTPNITEKSLLGVIANAVADSSDDSSGDIRSRKIAIVNGQGTVHGSKINLDENYGLSDNCWR